VALRNAVVGPGRLWSGRSDRLACGGVYRIASHVVEERARAADASHYRTGRHAHAEQVRTFPVGAGFGAGLPSDRPGPAVLDEEGREGARAGARVADVVQHPQLGIDRRKPC
jgi:hypothetical protein